MYSFAACMVVGALIGLFIIQTIQLLAQCSFTDEEIAQIKRAIEKKKSSFSRRFKSGKDHNDNGRT